MRLSVFKKTFKSIVVIFLSSLVFLKSIYIFQMLLNCSLIFISEIAGYPGNAILGRTLDSRGLVVRY